MTGNSKLITNRSEETLLRLQAALHRLLEGSPERTKLDGRISISRVNAEAGLSSGAIYYYKEFVKEAKEVIANRKSKQEIALSLATLPSTEKVRIQRDNEKRLKEEYRDQRDQIKSFCDQVVAKNASLEFALFEALEKIESLQDEIRSMKVIEIKKVKHQ
jgi:hypothetical protein